MDNNVKYANRQVRRGEIYFANLPKDVEGSVQAGKRPVLITQCNRLNRTSTTVVVAIITSKLKRPNDEVHVVLPMLKGLPKQSMVEAEQRKTISKTQLLNYCCTLDEETMKKVTRALRVSEKPDSTGRNKSKNIKRKRKYKSYKEFIKNGEIAQVQKIKKTVNIDTDGKGENDNG